MIEHWSTIYPDCPVEDVWVMGFDLPEFPVSDEQTGGRRIHVSPDLSSALHTFSYWIANGTVGMPLLEGIDYLSVCQEEPLFFRLHMPYSSIIWRLMKMVLYLIMVMQSNALHNIFDSIVMRIT